MAFWGTPREDAWRRRKDREYERENAIRMEESQKLIRLAASHAQERKEQEGVLDLARGLLSDARYDSQVARRGNTNTNYGGRDNDGKEAGIKRSATEESEGNNKRPRIKQEEDDESVRGGGRDDQATTNADSKDKQAEESVREHLLALSYSMFDTLHGTRSFQPKPFCEFLIKSGERLLAEQIALAAMEKSRGKGDNVAFILEELLPNSSESDEMLRSVKEVLSDDHCEQSGKDVFFQWNMTHGNTDEAFATILLITDEVERLKRALPLATTAARRQQLKGSCKRYLRDQVIGIFEDDEWPAFMQSVTFRPRREIWHGAWSPEDESYLNFAANSIKAPRSTIIGKHFLKKVIEKKMIVVTQEMSNFQRTRLPTEGAKVLTSSRERLCNLMKYVLGELDAAILSNESVMSSLRKINVDPLTEIAASIKSLIQLPPVFGCSTRHTTSSSAFRSCTKCRDKHWELAFHLGMVRGVRQHPLTANCESFHGIGLPCTPAYAAALLEQAHVQPDAVPALIGAGLDEIKLSCATSL